MKFVKFINSLDISKIKRINYREDINGLRAVAVMSVVFYHADYELFKGGYLGVDIFFVISGYLISNIVISELNQGTFSFKNFYKRRAIRILPALLSTIILTIPVAFFLLTPKAMQEYLSSMISAVFFYANYYFQNLDFYVAETTKVMPFLHTWTLAIEEQYYLLFPLLTFAVYKYKKQYLLFFFFIITFTSLFLNSLTQELVKFYQIQFRVWELLLGVLIMIINSNLKIKHLEKIGFPLLIFAIIYFDDKVINSIEPKLIAVIGMGLVIFSNTEKTFLTKILSLNIFKYIGVSSFSIYLFHQPIFSFFRIYFTEIKWEDLSDSQLSNFKIFIAILLTLLLGYLNYLLIEKYFLKTKNIKLIYFLILFIVFANFTLNNFDNRNHSQNNNKITDYTINIENYTPKLDGKLCHEVSEISNICSFNSNKKNKVILLGDSQAREIGYLLSLKLNDYNFEILTGNSCIFLSNQQFYDRCPMLKNNDEFKDYILNQSNSVFIYSGDLWGENRFADLQVSIPKTIYDILDNNNKVLIIEQIPHFAFNPIEKIYQGGYEDGKVVMDYDVWKKQKLAFPQFQIYDKIIGDDIYKISPENFLCNNLMEDYCVAALGENIYYRDANHLTVEGVDLFVDEIINILNASNK